MYGITLVKMKPDRSGFEVLGSEGLKDVLDKEKCFKCPDRDSCILYQAMLFDDIHTDPNEIPCSKESEDSCDASCCGCKKADTCTDSTETEGKRVFRPLKLVDLMDRLSDEASDPYSQVNGRTVIKVKTPDGKVYLLDRIAEYHGGKDSLTFNVIEEPK